MNENYKELYSYLKDNGLTDLDETSFFNEYSSNESKFNELYSYLKGEGMTDLSSNDFKNKYLSSQIQPKKKEDGGLLQEAQRTIQQYSQSLSPSQESESQQLSPSVSSLVEPYKEQKVKKLSPVGTTIPAIDYTTMQEDLSWQDKTGVSQSSINQNKIESEEKAKELAILEEKRRKKEAADDITRAREMFARRAEEEKIRLENEKLNLDYRTKDLNFLSNLNSVTSDLISTTEENVVQKLNEKFKGNGIVFEEAGWGTNRIIARTEDGKSSINIGSYNFLDSANTSEAEKLRNFISKNAKRTEDIGDRDFLSNSLKAQNLRAVPMIENGEPSTVRFTSFEEDGKFLVIPTLFPKDPNKYTTNPSTWMELPFEQARKVAMERGEVFTFKTQKEADDFAKGSWKDVNTIDIEGDSFFKALGKDYMTEKKRYERFTELDDIIDFAEKVYKYEGTSMTEQELQKKYPKYFISGKARFDLEKMLPEMKKERDALKPLVKDYTFFNQEGTSEDARMMWDKYLQDRNNQISSQAAAVNRDAKIQEMNLDKKSYEKFGVSIKDLKNYAVTNPSQKKEYDQLINQYVDAQDKKVIASEYMQEAKLYFDAKDNKNIMQEFSENFSGVVNSTLDAYRENAGGAALLNFAIGLKNASKIKDVKEASEYIKNLRESMSGTQSKELTRFQNVSDFSELIDVISDDPISVITSLVGSSFATQLPVGTKIIPATVLTSTAYGGATAGLPGAVGGFFSGLSTGQAITEFATEYNTALIDAIKKRGYDMEDPYSLQKALLNKEVWDEALEIGVTRGIPMAIMEKVTGGLSGRVFVPSSRLATTASKLKGYALESAVIDPTSEMLGELAAQGAMVATGKQDKIQYTELYGEFLGGLGAKSMTNGASTLYKIVRDHNNINLAYDLTDVANIAKENVSDERIMSWADNMVRLGKIDNTVAHRIRENVGLKREAKELMSVGEKPSNEVVARTMELMAAKQELTKTKNRSEVYRDKISEIDEELANMASTKKVADKDNQTSLVGITEAVRPSVAEYTINNRRYTKERFLDKINSMSPGRISRNDVKVVGDEEIVNLLNKKTNAVQEQTAGQVSVQPTTGVSQEVAQGESQTEPQVATQEVVKTEEVVTAPKATVDIFNSTPNETKANITFVSTDGNEVALQDNESEAASLYDEAVSIPLQQRTEEQVSLIEKLQPVVDQFKTTEVTPAAETKTPDQEADLLEELVSGKKTTPTETTETKVEFTAQDRNRKRELEDGLKYSDKRRKTVLIGGVTMTRSEANAELDALKQKETTSIESEVASIEKLFSEKKDDGNKQKVLEQVNRAIKAVRSILPKTKVVVHDTNEAYESATGDAGGSSGIFIPSKDGGTIHINLSKSNTRTVAHEVFHAVLLRGIKTDAEAKRLADAMIKAVRKSLEQSSDKKTLEEFNKFVNQYDQDIQNEEYLAEVFGYLAENFKQLPKPAQGIISKFLERIAKLFGIKPMTDSEVIDFMNTISRKVSTGEEVTESDINAFTQMKEGLESQGGSGFVGTFSIPRKKIDYEIIQATSAKDDSRDWVKNLVQDVDIREFDGQSFITNMYDYTNAGVTDLGNGITLNLFGGKNYVPYMMSLRGLKIGDLSNLAAFNTKANAEGFIRNARESGATLFSPHAGTKNQSWQFQHAIFEELVKAVLNNNVLTEKELIQIFNQGLINKKGNYIVPFAQFRKKYGNISDFSEFENNPLGLVELLNIENNYSPNLRKRLVDLLVADKKFQKKIGIKNKGQFYERIEDPLNKGVVGGELMGIVKFDPNTFKIRKTKPGDIDHHPSFGWTLEANIEGIYQPTEFYKSYDVTDSYTKYNKKEVVVSKKGESTVKNFIKSNVSSSAGALPKVATFENLSPRKQKVKKDESLKENSIFEEQKNKKDEIQSERERDGRGRTEGRTIAPLEGTPTVQGFSGPDAQLTSVAEEYAKENGIPYKRQGEYVKVDENRAKRIAQAYEEMKHDPQNPKVKEAYENLIKQTIAQYEALVKAGYKFWFIDTNIPSNLKYAESPYNAMRDIRNNKEMGVFPTTDGFGSSDIDVSDNPLMAETKFKWPVGGMDGELKPVLANDLFRAVHDAFGHGLEGAGFRARGEENAWQAHIRLFTGSAIGAITSETRGQNSWLNFGPYGESNRSANTEDTIFADQKTGLMPEWTWKEGVAPDMEDKANQEIDEIEQLPAARKQIIGENAKLAQDVRDNLQIARNMETAGKDAKTIRITTGWEKGKDNKWKYEIDDANVDEGELADMWEDGVESNLENLLLDSELLKLYPQLKDIKIKYTEYGEVANYDDNKNKISIPRDYGYDTRFKSVLLHEIQHAIQVIEGFALGGSPEQMITPNDVLAQLVRELPNTDREQRIKIKEAYRQEGLTRLPIFPTVFDIQSDSPDKLDEFIEKLDVLTKLFPNVDSYKKLQEGLEIRLMEMRGEDISFEKYRKLAGEVEARNVQTRMEMTPEQRRQATLQETEDVAREDQVIFFDTNLSPRQQKSKNNQEIIKQARANGISEAGIRAYFKKNGLTDIEIDELLEKTEGAKGKIELSEETLPGYTKLMNRIKDVIKRSRSRGLSENQIMENVIANVESRSPEYANATDQQREQIIRDIRKMFGKKEKAAPSAKKILGINFSNKLTIEERVLRDLQIKAEIRGAKNVVAKMKLMKQYINSVVRDWSKGVKGKVSLAQMKNIISKLNKTNLLDDGSINKFIDYMFNVINDAEYGNKLSQANSNIKEIKTKIKNLKEIKSPILKELAKQFSKLDPSLVEDIDLFNSIANNILDNLSKNTVADVINYQDLSLWLAENRNKQEEIKKARLVPIIEEITGQDAKDLTYDQMIEILESLKEKSTEKDETEIREKLQEAFDNAVIAYQFDEKNPIVDRFINIDLSKLSVSEIVEVVYALANYIENKDTAKMETIISMYEGNQSAESVSKKNLKISKFRAFSRFMNEQFAALPILFEKLFNGVKRGMYVMDMMGLSTLINSSNEAKNIFNGIVADYVSKFYSQNPNSQEFNTLYNNVERGMLAALLRSPVGNIDAIKKDFERNRGLILDAIEKLSMGDDNQVKIAQIYQQVYDKILKDSKDATEVLSKVDPINAEAVNWWINQWSDVYDEMYDVSLNVYNKQLDKDYNYTSSKFSFINLQEDIIEDDMSSYDYATGSSKMYEKMAGNLMKAIKPTSRNLNKGMYLDLNFDTVNANAMSSVLVDIKTAASIKKVKGFVESKYFPLVIPDANMRAVITKRINDYIKNIRKKRPYDSDEFGKVINLLETIAKYATSQALGGVTQPIKQIIPGMLNTITQTLDLSFIVKVFNSDVHKFLNESGYGISNRGVEASAQLESINKMIEIAAQDQPSKVIKKIGDINDMMLKALLVKPDIFIARASWIAYYEQYMRKNNKGQKINYATHKINKEAADYAETMTSRQLNLNDADLAGSFFLSNDTGKKWIRNTLLPFANFRINQYLRTASDVSRIVNFKTTSKEDRVIAIRSLVGTIAEMVLYKSIAVGIGLGLTGLAMAVRGDDDEEEWERAYSNAIKGSATSAVTDFLSPIPLTDQFVRGGVGEFINQVQALNDVPVEDRWNIFTKDELDVLDTYGKLGIPLKRAFEIKDGAELVLTGKFEDKYGNVKYITDQDREILLYGVLGGAFVNVFGLGVGPEYNNTYNKIVKQAKRDAQTEKQIEKKIMLGDWETKEDMKRYAPEEYEKKFGKGGVYYEESKSDSEEKKAEREEERKNKDEMYGYKEKPKKSSSKGVMNSKGIMGGKGISRKGIMGSKGISK